MLRLAPLLLLLLLLLRAAHSAPKPDFIIVGAGTSGSALAARLCILLPHATITVLERGKPRTSDQNFRVSAPRLQTENSDDPDLVEAFQTAAEPGLLGRRLDVLTGATLGGSSAINGAQWNPPSPAAVAAWNLSGLDAAAASVLEARAAAQLSVALPPIALRHSLWREFLTAAALSALPNLPAPFAGPRVPGVYYNRVTVDAAARRQDAYTAYLAPALAAACRGRVNVIQGATVVRLSVAARPRRPFGAVCTSAAARKTCRCSSGPNGAKARFVRAVRYLRAGGNATAVKLRARHEVLLAAGPFGSPKLLQLSGIGPRALLHRLGIRLRADLPVGMRAQGKALLAVLSFYTGRPVGPENDADQVFSAKARRRWERGNGGPLGISLSAINGFFGSGSLLQILQVASARAGLLGRPNFLSLCLQGPKSFGTIEIAGKDPFRPPRAQLNFLTKQEEVDELLQCTRKLREVNSKLDASVRAFEVAPGAATLNETYVRGSAINTYHLVGGCAVGSVLDSELRVQGFDNLRVVDTSSIPVMPPFAGPMASAYILAEHAAEVIVGQYNCTRLGRPVRTDM